MAHGHGGARRNAGRRKAGAQLLLHKDMDRVIGTERWQRMLERVVDKIEKSGDANAFYRLASMRYGLPAQSDDEGSDAKYLEINEVDVILPTPPPPIVSSRRLRIPVSMGGAATAPGVPSKDSDLATSTNDNPDSVSSPGPDRTGPERTAKTTPAPGSA